MNELSEGDLYLKTLADAKLDAERTAVYYLRLIDQGIPAEDALHLTGEWLHAMTEEWEEEEDA